MKVGRGVCLLSEYFRANRRHKTSLSTISIIPYYKSNHLCFRNSNCILTRLILMTCRANSENQTVQPGVGG